MRLTNLSLCFSFFFKGGILFLILRLRMSDREKVDIFYFVCTCFCISDCVSATFWLVTRKILDESREVFNELKKTLRCGPSVYGF